MLKVFSVISTGNQEVVNITEAKIKTTKYQVNELLKCIPRAKRHMKKFEKAKGGNHCCFWDVIWLNGNAHTRSILLMKTLVPCREAWMWGTGYPSGMVQLLRGR